MILVFIQAVLVIGAGVGLFLLWRLAAPSERWLRYVVAAGFFGRAILGQALFWISWERLPIARGMQLGDGLWIFAADAFSEYVPAAFWGAEEGLWAIIMFDRRAASVMYVQTLGVTAWLFGPATSAGLLLNLFCYLGMIATLVHWPCGTLEARAAAAVAITALSLSPALVLWSLQPLKDTFFQFLVVAFVASCAWWQRSWSMPGRIGSRLGAGLLLAAVLYAVAGVRWYFAFAMLIAASLFLFLTAFITAGRTLIAFSAAAILTIVFCRLLVASASPYMPPDLTAALSPSTAIGTIGRLPAVLLGGVDSARAGFQRSGGRTAILEGEPSQTESPPPTQRPSPLPDVVQPRSRVMRLISGVAVTVLPRTIGESLGFFHIVGGRGMLWLTELDTLIFDLSLLLAIAALIVRFRASIRDPLTWLLVTLTLLIGGPLVYSITNYGALFRLREMIFLGLILLPLAAATARPARAHAETLSAAP